MSRKFDIKTGAHGASAVCLIYLLAATGIILLFEIWNPRAIGWAFLLGAAVLAISLYLFGFRASENKD